MARMGVGREPGMGRGDCVPRLQMPPQAAATLPGNRQTGLVLPRDEKFCMAGCREKQRQSGLAWAWKETHCCLSCPAEWGSSPCN